MGTEVIKCEVADHIALVTMDRPPVNAVNAQFHEELMRVFDTLSDREDVRAAILIGAGKMFCAGADIKARIEREPQPGDFWSHGAPAASPSLKNPKGRMRPAVDCGPDGFAIHGGGAPCWTIGILDARMTSSCFNCWRMAGSPLR